MAATEIRLGASHIAGCVALSAAAGWNQNAADWRLMLELGEGWGLELGDGTLAASTLVIPYGSFAWVSMVLVLPAHRRRGYATKLLRIAIGHLSERKLTAVLDATPAGQTVYRQVGFRAAWGFRRFIVQGKPQRPASSGVRALRETDWPWIRSLDLAAFGGNREPVLRSLAGRLPEGARVVEGEGFIFGRDGREAPQLGPLVATTVQTARALLETTLSQASGPRYLDIADHAALAAEGLAAQRPFMRMIRGAGPAPGDPRKVFLVAGPELG